MGVFAYEGHTITTREGAVLKSEVERGPGEPPSWLRVRVFVDTGNRAAAILTPDEARRFAVALLRDVGLILDGSG